MASAPAWQIYIDTGGTFTDCLAHDPQGALHRAKVLSKSALRGKILEQIDDTRLRVTTYWDTREDIFAGYAFSLIMGNAVSVEVVYTNLREGMLTLSEMPAQGIAEGAEFEITAGEEAPILAARIVTGTPLHALLPPIAMRLGSTKGTNALLERKGARVALLITEGLTDLPEIGTQQRPHLFALDIHKPRSLHTQVIPVPERIAADGTRVRALTPAAIEALIEVFLATGCEVAAVSLLHSYRNPLHEQQLGAAFRARGIEVSLSHELAPTIKLLPRTQTTLVNAYLSPVIRNYREAVRQGLGPQSTLKIMTSAGGLVGEAFFQPKDSLLSGPAGGVVGAASIGARTGIQQMLTLDMGGTSTDVARYDGHYDYQFESRVGDAHLLGPCLAIETVAAGGGSICGFDGFKLTVGPESAGSQPGPACYGAGGPLTLTDVNLLLGRIDPTGFGIPLDIEAARKAFQAGMSGQQFSETEILEGFLHIANEKMAEAIRGISVRKGYDPRDYTLLAFGGAGGQHACQVAQLLGISRISIPYDAGLLSAFGMGQAVIERFVTRQFLLPLLEVRDTLAGQIEALKHEALDLLAKEIAEREPRHIRGVLLQMRFRGQDHTLEISYSPETDLTTAFRVKYESLFGHWIEDRVIEVESVKVIAATLPPSVEPVFAEITEYVPTPQRYLRHRPVYEWESLRPGAAVVGPALVVSKTSTLCLDAGWEFRLDAYRDGRIQQQAGVQTEVSVAGREAGHEAIQLELFTHRFMAVAAEMGALLERTSFSVNVKERLDFSCALLDAAGELIVNAPHIPVHLGSLGVCVREVRKVLQLEAGDIAITNHPGFGGSHLPDITLISPVYFQEKHIGYVVNRAHHAELGGMRPGSMPPDAKHLGEEGVVIAPTWLVRRGQPQWEEIRRIFTQGPYPTRALAENLADLNAGIASIRAGIAAVGTLCRLHGSEAVCHYMEQLKSYAHASLLRSLATFPEGLFTAEETLDDGTPLRVAIRHTADQLHIDFTGSAGVHPGNLNANAAIVNSAVLYVLRLMLQEDIPLNEGILRAVTLVLPEGILSPHFPADPMQCPAVVGGNVETSQRLVDTLLKALGLAACSQGTMNNLLFGNEHFGYYETICGGVGAGPGFDGADAVHQHMTNTRITDPEILEFRYPVRLERFAIRQDSGGRGKWRGGKGVVREIRFLAPVSLTILSQHRRVAPYGLAGGEPGSCGEQFLIRANGKVESIAGIAGVQMQTGDRIEILTPGGGGYGAQDM